MKGLTIWLAMLAVCVLLAKWKPPAESLKRLFRDYGIVLIGILLFYYGLTTSLRFVGLGEYAAGQSLLYVVLGLGYALGSATKTPTFWNVHSNWPLWSFLSERWLQAVGVGLGLFILAGGLTFGRQERTAYRICRNWYAAAASVADSADVAARVPDPSLRPPRGRFESHDRPPMTCDYLYR
jgi:hypothetical protein